MLNSEYQTVGHTYNFLSYSDANCSLQQFYAALAPLEATIDTLKLLFSPYCCINSVM